MQPGIGVRVTQGGEGTAPQEPLGNRSQGIEGSVCRVTSPGKLQLRAFSASKGQMLLWYQSSISKKRSQQTYLSRLSGLNLCVNHRTTAHEHCSCGGFMTYQHIPIWLSHVSGCIYWLHGHLLCCRSHSDQVLWGPSAVWALSGTGYLGRAAVAFPLPWDCARALEIAGEEWLGQPWGMGWPGAGDRGNKLLQAQSGSASPCWALQLLPGLCPVKGV